MLSRIHGAAQFFAQSRFQSLTWTTFARAAAKGLIATAHRALLVLGGSAIAALCILFFKPNLADRIKSLSPFAEPVQPNPSVAVTPPLTSLLEMPHKPTGPEAIPSAGTETFSAIELYGVSTLRQRQLVTSWLSKRYHVANDATDMLVSASYTAAKDTKLDPLLILAVMCIESGLNPFAESPMGAQGLMQVMSKVHHDKFQELGGIKAALNPVANIKVGSLILKDYVTRGGSVEAGLKLYVGAAAFDNDAGYGSKVLAEYHRLKDVATGKNVPPFTAPVVTSALKPHQLLDSPNGTKPAMENEPDSAALFPKTFDAKANQLAAL